MSVARFWNDGTFCATGAKAHTLLLLLTDLGLARHFACVLLITKGSLIWVGAGAGCWMWLSVRLLPQANTWMMVM